MLKILEGMTITKAEEVHDYIQIGFGADIGVSIYNEFSVTPEVASVNDLVGSRVVSVSETPLAIGFKFDIGRVLTIDLQPPAWRGPEAIQLNRRGQPTVIWN